MPQIRRRLILAALASAGLCSLARAQVVDLAAETAPPIRGERDEAAIALLKDVRLLRDDTLTVAINVGRLPLAGFAADGKTPVGSEPGIAQLLADGLGRKLEIVPVAWADWPLGLASGKYDAVISNVTVTEARKEKFDFSTYRKDQLGAYVKTTGPIAAIKGPEDIAGLRIIVGAGTNQEQILLRWNQQNAAKGLKPAELQYYDDDAVRALAIQSGRADVYFGPNAIAAYEARRDGKTRLVGSFSGGWPVTAEIAVATRKGSGLAEAATKALNTQIAHGAYAKVLARWSLSEEAIGQSRTNPPGLPKS